jgi:hypothetical protein
MSILRKEQTELKQIVETLNDPSGFPVPADVQISWSDSTPDRTLTIQPAVSSFDVWIKGTKYTKTSLETIQIDNIDALHIIYYTVSGSNAVLASNDNLSLTELKDIFENQAIVAFVYWDTTNTKQIYLTGANELHSTQMDGSTHFNIHITRGTQFLNGMALNTIDADQSGDNNTHAQFGVDSGKMQDEDIFLTLSTITSITGLPIYYRSGASGLNRQLINSGFSVVTTGTGRLAWNQFTGGAWQLTEVTNNDFVLCHVFAVNDSIYPYIAIMGQNEYSNLNSAREGANIEINNLILTGLDFSEFIPVATVIFQTSDGYGNDVQARIVTTDLGSDYIDWRFTGLSPASISVTSHSNLTGLTNDDHLQYTLLAGRSGGQSLIGGIDASDDLILESTSNGTKGKVISNSELQVNNDLNITGIYKINGDNALSTPSPFNLHIGKNAGNAIGSGNICIGEEAGYLSNGVQSVFIGVRAGKGNITGSDNVCIGYHAGRNIGSSAFTNIFIGTGSGLNAQGNENTCVGYQTGAALLVSGINNVFIGSNSGVAATSADNNVLIGRQAGVSLTSGDRNVIIGSQSGVSLLSGSNNIFIGDTSGSAETGSNKLYIGFGSSPLIYGDFSTNLLQINGDLIITGNLTAQGTTTSVETTNLDVEDKNILINHGGTTTLSVGAGINIEGDAAAVVGYLRVGSADNSLFEFKSPAGNQLILDINADKTIIIAGALNIEADSAINQDLTTDANVQFNNTEIDGALNHDGSTIGFYGTTPVVKDTGWTITNKTLDRILDCDNYTTDELADVVGTLVDALKATGIIG